MPEKTTETTTEKTAGRSYEINRLDPITASKIAAGEVVEKPVNVIKELLENSLDAGATNINIDIYGHGLELIRVSDNGKGIHYNDLALSVERFATSKAKSVEDVYNISTFGFRGEALAAISAVSEFYIKSVRSGDEPGEVVVLYGEVQPIKATSIDNGTEVSVKKIFDKLPVRKKFLRSNNSIQQEIVRFVKQFSLINKGVEFVLNIEGKQVYKAYAQTPLLERVKQYFDDDRFKPGEFTDGDYTVRVYTSHPTIQRPRRDNIIIGINGRLIKNSALLQAVVQSYHRRIPQFSYPCTVLDITVPPSDIDVNIHPTKSEVNLVNASSVFSMVLKATDVAINRFSELLYAENDEELNQNEVEQRRVMVKDLNLSAELKSNPLLKSYSAPHVPFKEIPSVDISQIIESASVYDVDMSTQATSTDSGRKHDDIIDVIKPQNTDQLTIIGQLAKTYILCEYGNEFLIIDQHVAHERILYEKYTNDKHFIRPTISLFEPVVIELSAEDYESVNQYSNEINSYGIGFDAFGENSIKITALPVASVKKDVKNEFISLLRDLINLSPVANEDRLKLVMSCRNAVKAGDALSHYEMLSLVNELFKTANRYTCPHGRPIIQKFKLSDIAKYFNRS